MRVSGDSAAGADRAAREPVNRRPFGDLLARARREARRAADARGAPLAKEGSLRRVAADRGAATLRVRRTGFDDGERIRAEARPPGSANAEPAADVAGAPGSASLRAAIRAAPSAIQAASVRAGAPLRIDLGRALSVELARGRGGVEVVLRPEPRFAREAAAELPGLVRALRARGIPVARAEVRPRGPGPPAASLAGGDARVDAGRGLR